MIPFPTTLVQLLSPGEADTPAENWGGAPDAATGYEPLGDPVRAHLSFPSGYANASSGESTSGVEFRLIADTCPMQPDMMIADLSTGQRYQVTWCLQRTMLLPHTIAGVRQVSATS